MYMYGTMVIVTLLCENMHVLYVLHLIRSLMVNLGIHDHKVHGGSSKNHYGNNIVYILKIVEVVELLVIRL